ncbi:MAG: energy-coupled thiamine transporter ThiT [Clostridia bacterium]|nr:energy-coupled thiamine transporter ThiT [Clostridia bacterium]
MLDYPVAFCCVGLAGLFQKNNVLSKFSVYLGAALAGIMRFLSSTISGTVYWGTPWAGSVAYNSAILVDMAICIVIIFLLFRSKSFVNYVNSKKPNYVATKENPDDIKL